MRISDWSSDVCSSDLPCVWQEDNRMAEDWLADVRKYVADADETVVSAIVKYLGIALRNRDSSLVSFSDKKETDRVRENFLKKKLGLTEIGRASCRERVCQYV